MTEYVVGDESTSAIVVVDDKTLSRGGEPVDLSQEEYDRATAVEGVQLVEASEASEQSEQSEQPEQVVQGDPSAAPADSPVAGTPPAENNQSGEE